jgi:hypothetical protein
LLLLLLEAGHLTCQGKPISIELGELLLLPFDLGGQFRQVIFLSGNLAPQFAL